MKFNNWQQIIRLNIFDESDEVSIEFRNSNIRTACICINFLISVAFMISVVSLFFTHDWQPVFITFIVVSISKLIQGLLEYSQEMKATGLNSMCMSLLLTSIALINFLTL